MKPFQRRLCLLLLIIACTMTASAMIWRVDPVAGSDTNDGSSWIDEGAGVGPLLSIQAAIDAAETASGGDVWLKKGLHQPTTTQTVGSVTHAALVMKSDVIVLGGFEGTESDAGERGPVDPFATVIDGSVANEGGPAGHVMLWEDTQSVAVERVTIRGGRAPDENSRNGNGAGFLMTDLDATNTLTDCWIIDNRKEGGNGTGGGGGYATASSVVFTRCLFAGNASPQRFAGGFAFPGQGTPRFDECIFTGNYSNRAGGVYTDSGGPKIINRSVFAGNMSTNLGGAIYMNVVPSFRLSGSLIAGNRSQTGGAGYVGDGCNLIVTNCTVADNTRGGTAGGFFFGSFQGFPTVSPMTVRFRNTIFSGNEDYALRESRTDTDITELSNCLFRQNGAGDFFNEGNTDITGAAALNALSDVEAANNLEGDPVYEATLTGMWTSAVQDGVFLQLTDSTLTLTPGELKGKLLKPDTAGLFLLSIIDNTEDTVTVIAADEILSQISTTGNYEVRTYRIEATSAAEDTGADFRADAPESAFDLTGLSRPRGMGFDLGVYEIPGLFFPSVALSSSPNPGSPGGTVTFTATVTGESATGSVEFFDGLTSLGTMPLSGNTAEVMTNSLTLGEHDMTARYSGDANNNPSVSPVYVQTVGTAQPVVAIIEDSPDPSITGSDVLLRVTVQAPRENLPEPTGTVEFFVDDVTQGTNALTNGESSLSVPITATGDYALHVTYSGDSNYEPGTSPDEPHTVVTLPNALEIR